MLHQLEDHLFVLSQLLAQRWPDNPPGTAEDELSVLGPEPRSPQRELVEEFGQA
jgi:hypothetical protein